MKEWYYNVAGHTFCVAGDEVEYDFCELKAYEPFVAKATEHVIFRLHITTASRQIEDFCEDFRQKDEGQEIVVGHLSSTGEPCLTFWLGKKQSATLIANKDYSEGEVSLMSSPQFGLNNAIMILYALTTANQHTALFHSSVVSCDGKAYMFLGESGTGKSTHSSLWLKYIKGTELVNDDNPVVRILDHQEVRVYGSPWSGKTPCYRNVDYPLGGLVDLAQAPYNNIRRLKGIEAYVALVPSISGMRWNEQMAQGLHDTEDLLAQLVPVWHLDCLPDEGAAQLSHQSCTNGNNND